MEAYGELPGVLQTLMEAHTERVCLIISSNAQRWIWVTVFFLNAIGNIFEAPSLESLDTSGVPTWHEGDYDDSGAPR